MSKHSSKFWQTLQEALKIDLIAIPIMLAIWLIFMQSTITNLINIFIIGGILLMGAGGSYVGGSRSYLSDRIAKRSEKVVYSEQHVERDREKLNTQYDKSIKYIIAGGIPLSIAILLAVL